MSQTASNNLKIPFAITKPYYLFSFWLLFAGPQNELSTVRQFRVYIVIVANIDVDFCFCEHFKNILWTVMFFYRPYFGNHNMIHSHERYEYIGGEKRQSHWIMMAMMIDIFSYCRHAQRRYVCLRWHNIVTLHNAIGNNWLIRRMLFAHWHNRKFLLLQFFILLFWFILISAVRKKNTSTFNTIMMLAVSYRKLNPSTRTNIHFSHFIVPQQGQGQGQFEWKVYEM